MPLLSRLFSLLPKMVPLGVITVAVVLAWGRFYQTVGNVVCQASAALGGNLCAPGSLPDARALLDDITGGDDGSPLDPCKALAAGVLANAALCEDGSPGSPTRRVLVVGESQTFEYSIGLARKHPAWDVLGTSLQAVPASLDPALPNLKLRGGVDATALGTQFSQGQFTDVVYNAPRALQAPRAPRGWYGPAGELIDSVLVSATAVVGSGGAVRFSSGGGMPGKYRLDGHVRGDARYPIPDGYARPATRVQFFADAFGVPYTPRDNEGKALAIRAAEMSWYIFRRL